MDGNSSSSEDGDKSMTATFFLQGLGGGSIQGESSSDDISTTSTPNALSFLCWNKKKIIINYLIISKICLKIKAREKKFH